MHQDGGRSAGIFLQEVGACLQKLLATFDSLQVQQSQPVRQRPDVFNHGW